MTDSGRLPKLLAAALALCVPALDIPVSAAPAEASLEGTIVAAADHAPLAGVRLHAGDPGSGRIYSSDPTSEDGSFAVRGLPPAGYELAVEAEGGLYLVRTPVQLAPGSAQRLTLAVSPEGRGDEDDDSDGEEDDDDPAAVPRGGRVRKVRLWDSQLTAAGLVLGMAFVVGALVENATEDNDVVVSNPNPGG